MSIVQSLLEFNSNVHIHDDKRMHVEQTIRSLIKDGRQMLHVVADFDFTLTMYEKDGESLPSTFAVIESNDLVILPDGSSLRIQADQLRSKYQLIEHDIKMSTEEKIPHMIDWWQQAQSLLIASNLDLTTIRNLVYQSKMELKKGARKFIGDLIRSDTPILIFSAGLGDVIQIFLEKEVPEFKHNNELSHIVSNFMQYDANEKLIACSKKLIHSFNKNEHEIHDTPYYQTILNRPNVILLGDTLGDVGMVSGMRNLKQILKIGYLNRSTPDKLEKYMSVYDIVLCDDQTFDVPNLLLKAI